MDSRGHLSNRNGRYGPPENILQLCKQIIKKDIVDSNPQLALKIDETIKTNFDTSVRILNNAPSAQDDNTINEFTVAENIKKYLVSKIPVKLSVHPNLVNIVKQLSDPFFT